MWVIMGNFPIPIRYRKTVKWAKVCSFQSYLIIENEKFCREYFLKYSQKTIDN